jgi:hypothetical protein
MPPTTVVTRARGQSRVLERAARRKEFVDE